MLFKALNFPEYLMQTLIFVIFTVQIEITEDLREKGKLFRARRKLQKTLSGYEDLIFGCYNEYSSAREDFVVDCNQFDYYPEDVF